LFLVLGLGRDGRKFFSFAVGHAHHSYGRLALGDQSTKKGQTRNQRAAYMPCALPARQRRRADAANTQRRAKVGPFCPSCQVGTDEVRSVARGCRVNLTPWPGIRRISAARRTDRRKER
jgi:hypothetical protein